MEEIENLKVTLNPNGVPLPLYRVISENSRNVLLGMKFIETENEEEDTLLLSSEDGYFTTHYELDGLNLESTDKKRRFKKWILTKGFEDLIKGINLCLIEAYFYISLYSQRDNLKQYHQLITEIEKLRKEASSLHLPELVKRIKPHLTKQLKYEKHIVSLNKGRNCLVHRNGIVSEKDSNTEEGLKITVIKMNMTAEKDNHKEPLIPPMIIDGGTKISVEFVDDEIIFPFGSNMEFNYQHFNSLLFTCYQFGEDLKHSLPTIDSN